MADRSFLNGVFRERRILVTGHTGFKGSWLSRWLIELGAQVAGYSIDVPTKPSLFEQLQLEKRLQHHWGDVRDLDSLQNIFEQFRPEIVFHLAAQPLVRASYDQPKETFDVNVGGTVNVLEAVRRSSSTRAAVFVATDKCYENIEQTKGYRETDPLGGHDPYSASKAAAEIAFQSYQRSFFSRQVQTRVASARAGNVIGGGDWAQDRIIPDCVRAWSKGQSVEVRHPDAIRPWQHVLEPLGGYLKLAQKLWEQDSSATGQSYNFGPREDSSRTVRDLIDGLRRDWPNADWKSPSQADLTRKESQILLLNCEKAQRQLDWHPLLNFEETVRWTADWYRMDQTSHEEAAALCLDQIQRYQSLWRT